MFQDITIIDLDIARTTTSRVHASMRTMYLQLSREPDLLWKRFFHEERNARIHSRRHGLWIEEDCIVFDCVLADIETEHLPDIRKSVDYANARSREHAEQRRVEGEQLRQDRRSEAETLAALRARIRNESDDAPASQKPTRDDIANKAGERAFFDADAAHETGERASSSADAAHEANTRESFGASAASESIQGGYTRFPGDDPFALASGADLESGESSLPTSDAAETTGDGGGMASEAIAAAAEIPDAPAHKTTADVFDATRPEAPGEANAAKAAADRANDADAPTATAADRASEADTPPSAAADHASDARSDTPAEPDVAADPEAEFAAKRNDWRARFRAALASRK